MLSFSIRTKCCGLLTKGVTILHENVHPHVSHVKARNSSKLCWDTLPFTHTALTLPIHTFNTIVRSIKFWIFLFWKEKATCYQFYVTPKRIFSFNYIIYLFNIYVFYRLWIAVQPYVPEIIWTPLKKWNPLGLETQFWTMPKSLLTSFMLPLKSEFLFSFSQCNSCVIFITVNLQRLNLSRA